MSTALLVPPAWGQVVTSAGLSPARGWIITPSLTTSETYTDNVGLTPAGTQRTEWVTTVSPAISVTESGPRLRFDAIYAPQLIYRLNDGTTDSAYHNLNATGNAELLRQFLYVDASARVYQINTSILGPQATSNVYNTGNRSTAVTASLSPYVRHKFGNEAEGVARFTSSALGFNSLANSSTTATAANPENSRENTINLSLTSGPAYKVYTWGVVYSRQTLSGTQGPGGPDITTESLTANGRRMITYQLYLLTSLGYTKSDYQTIGAASNHGLTSSYGLQWTPSPRTNVSATLGKSYYGDNRAFDLSYRTGLSVWSASYSETISTTHSQFASPSNVDTVTFLDPLFLSRFPDPAARQQAIREYITQNGLPASTVISRNLLTEQVFLSKRFSATAGILGRRNTVMASAYRQKNENQSTPTSGAGVGDFAQSNTNTVTGATVTWSSRLSPFASANVSGSYTRNEFPDVGANRVDNVKFVQVALTRQFAKGQSGTLSYHKSETASSLASSSFAENAVSATINLRY